MILLQNILFLQRKEDRATVRAGRANGTAL
jgi:hypothetical protein